MCCCCVEDNRLFLNLGLIHDSEIATLGEFTDCCSAGLTWLWLSFRFFSAGTNVSELTASCIELDWWIIAVVLKLPPWFGCSLLPDNAWYCLRSLSMLLLLRSRLTRHSLILVSSSASMISVSTGLITLAFTNRLRDSISSVMALIWSAWTLLAAKAVLSWSFINRRCFVCRLWLL